MPHCGGAAVGAAAFYRRQLEASLGDGRRLTINLPNCHCRALLLGHWLLFTGRLCERSVCGARCTGLVTVRRQEKAKRANSTAGKT